MRDATAALSMTLTVTRPNRDAEIVNVQYRSTDPLLAAAVPNLLLEQFIKYKSQSSHTKANSTVQFLRSQVASYETQLKTAESALGNFRESEKVVSLADEAAADVKRMAELQVERDRLMSEQSAIKAILRQALGTRRDSRARRCRIPVIHCKPWNAGHPRVAPSARDGAKCSARSAESGKRRRRGAYEPHRCAQHQLMQMSRGYLSGLETKIAAVSANIATFGRQIETIPTRQIQYARLARDQKLLEDLSTLLNRRLKEAEIEEAVEPGDAQLIDRALVPEKPASPKVALNLILGLVVGLGLGLLSGVGRDLLDTRVHTKEDLQAATGGIPVLAGIPRFSLKSSKLGSLKRSTDSRDTRQIAPGSGLITLAESRNASVEAYRSLRTSITFAGADIRQQVLVLTSAGAGDGKSTTAANWRSRSRSRECERFSSTLI
jgi:tyrosine-protein kinase Etk/Wzc